MQLLFFIYQSLGIFPYSLSRDIVNPVKKVSVTWYIYSVFFVVSYAIFHIFATVNYIIQPPVQFNFVSITVYFYNAYSDVIWIMLLIFAGLLKATKIMKAYQELANCDYELYKFFKTSINNRKFIKFQLMQNGCVCMGFLALEGINIKSRPTVLITMGCYIVNATPLIIATLIETQFIGFTQHMYARYCKINNLFFKYRANDAVEENEWHRQKPSIYISELYNAVKTRKRVTNFYSEKLRAIDGLYTRLYGISKIVESAFGIQIASMFMIYFIKLTTLLYTSR